MSSADFTDYADNSRSAGILPAYWQTGTKNLPAGCRRSQQHLRPFPSARIRGICGKRFQPLFAYVKEKSKHFLPNSNIPQKPTKITKSRMSSADFADYADNSRSAGILPAYWQTGTKNPPAGCRRSQQHLRPFPSARIRGICGKRFQPLFPAFSPLNSMGPAIRFACEIHPIFSGCAPTPRPRHDPDGVDSTSDRTSRKRVYPAGWTDPPLGSHQRDGRTRAACYIVARRRDRS
jgi:hypothetical protein